MPRSQGGRKPKLSERQVAVIRTMHASGEPTITALADTFKVTRPTIYRVLELPDPANIPRHTTFTPGVVRDTIRRLACLPKGWLQ